MADDISTIETVKEKLHQAIVEYDAGVESGEIEADDATEDLMDHIVDWLGYDPAEAEEDHGDE